MSIEPADRRGSSPRIEPPAETIPLARPRVADPARVAADVEAILRSGVLTNGPYVRRFEEARPTSASAIASPCRRAPRG